MEACRRSDTVRAALMVTTDKCYENLGWTWGYRENDRLGGADPYSNSKAACELAIDAYRRSFCADRAERHLGLASARAGNVIGGGDFALDRLVPDAMRAFMNGEVLQIRNSLSIRPWQHVLEALTGYLLLCERLHKDLKFAQGWNFGPQPDESAPVSQVVSTLQTIWGDGATWTQGGGEAVPEAATLKLDSTKASVELGWKTRLSLEQALAITVDWFKAYKRQDDMLAVTRRQIVEYIG
jgi:CDP-glucose 4,6-dehydratase